VVRKKQLEMPFRCWGGRRKGSGRKRKSQRRSVAHRSRPEHKPRFPAHVTLRVHDHLPNLRTALAHELILRVLVSISGRFGIDVVHYSVMPNHIHLIIEADDQEAIRAGVSALTIRIALALNRLWKRKGPVFHGRYHCRALKTPLDAHRSIAYVLRNAEHHGIHVPHGIDPCSSARWFEGWIACDPPRPAPEFPSPLPRAKTWLLTEGVKLHGPIDPLPEPTCTRKRKTSHARPKPQRK
jgi:REP element-mobilizing transposase RayT